MLKFVNSLIAHAQIHMGMNPRVIKAGSLSTLIESIQAVGIRQPIMVWESSKNYFEVIQGHRRFTSAMELLKLDATRFNDLFGKGIPCIVVEKCTPEEALNLKMDHDGQESLNDPHELQRSANMWFDAGKTPAEATLLLAGLMEKLSPLQGKALKEVKELTALRDAATTDVARKIAQDNLDKRVKEARHGMMQGLHATYRCPTCVMNALYKKCAGRNPDGVTEYLPPITSKDVTELHKAHKADLEIRENGVPKYNQQRVGPNFLAKWAKLIEEAKAAEENPEEKEAKPKAMSAKDMKQEVLDGKLKSELACTLVEHHSGNKEAAALLKGLDEASHYTDMIRKYDKSLWADVEKAAKLIVARLVEQDAKEAAAKKATETKAVEAKA